LVDPFRLRFSSAFFFWFLSSFRRVFGFPPPPPFFPPISLFLPSPSCPLSFFFIRGNHSGLGGRFSSPSSGHNQSLFPAGPDGIAGPLRWPFPAFVNTLKKFSAPCFLFRFFPSPSFLVFNRTALTTRAPSFLLCFTTLHAVMELDSRVSPSCSFFFWMFIRTFSHLMS